MTIGFPKPKPSKRAHPDAALDTRESKKVKKRSRSDLWPEGQCEIWEAHPLGILPAIRCHRAMTQVHHMIGGRGKRGIGPSALKEHKQATCDPCHRDITGDVGGRRLERVGGVVPLFSDPYRRIR